MGSLRSLAESLGPVVQERLEPGRIRFVCAALLIISVGLAVASFATSEQNETRFGTLGADYSGFYTAGTLLNEYPPDRLYDADLQDEVYHRLLPRVREQEKLPYLYPPFVALAFRGPARLPYAWSFALWLVISAGLYAAGLVLLLRVCPALSAGYRSTAVLLALAFEPFVMESWLGGQVSSFGFFCVALALFFARTAEKKGDCPFALEGQSPFFSARTARPVAAGAALGLLLYKPTLLVLLLPMLVMARRIRMVLGFGLTALGLAVISVLAVGPEPSFAYADKLLGFARTSSGGGLELKLWKYVDLNSFLRLLMGGRSPAQAVVLLAAVVVPLAVLVTAWWKFDRFNEAQRTLAWACPLAWTLVINVYVGVYDTLLVVPAVMLMADVLLRLRPAESARAFPAVFECLLVLLFVVPWFSQPLARIIRLQTFTLVLVAAGAYSLSLLRAGAGLVREEVPAPESGRAG